MSCGKALNFLIAHCPDCKHVEAYNRTRPPLIFKWCGEWVTHPYLDLCLAHEMARKKCISDLVERAPTPKHVGH